jgi:hypothetical protein
MIYHSGLFFVYGVPAPGRALDLISVGIFRWDIVFRNFGCSDFAFVRIFRVLDSAHHFRFEVLAFFRQFRDAFRIHAFSLGKTLRVSGLTAGSPA